MAEEENEHRRRLIELHRAEVRRAHPADPPPGREGLRQARAAVDGAAARPRQGAQAGRGDGVRGAPLLRAGHGAHLRRRHPQAAGRPRRRRARAHLAGAAARRPAPHAGRAASRGGDAPAHVRAAGRAAGARRTDGRLGVDLGAAVCRRVRHPSTPGRRSWSAWPPRWAPASPWALPRRCPTTASSPAAATPGCAARSPA